MNLSRKYLAIVVLFFNLSIVLAQDNYEIQVYESETVEKHHTVFELHSNYTPIGSTQIANGSFSSNHVLHETVEITHGFNEWFEVGAYLFTAIGSQWRTGFAGTHLRPRVTIPEELELPVGLSLSGEIGYQKLGFFGNVWMAEFRPIVDKKFGRLYFAINSTVNATLDKGLDHGWQFNPCFKGSYNVNEKAALGLEYYSGLGAFHQFSPIHDQKHLLFASLDYDLGPDWEFNAGIGYGLQGPDKLIVKCIIGKRFGF